MKNFLTTAIVVFMTIMATAQVTSEVTPRSWGLQMKNTVSPVIMPAFDLQTMLEEDARDAQDLKKSYRFGKNFEVNLDLFNSGQWTTLQNGDRIWRLNIHSPGANTMNLFLDGYSMPEGGEMYLYNNAQTEKLGPYTKNENSDAGQLGTWIITGDNLWLEYYEPAAVKNQGRIAIQSVVHGYRGFERNVEPIAKINESGACNVDVNCDPNQGSINGFDWTTIRDNYKNSVARILFPVPGQGSFLCTGQLINNTSNDGTPYFLTANHCVGSGSGNSATFNGSQWAFGFQWFTTTPDCATSNPTTGPQNPTRVITGAALRANDTNSDFALFQLNQTPPAVWNLYYAGWNRSVISPNAQLGVHHPSGDIMKLARNDEPAISQLTSFNGNNQTAVWRVLDYEYGVTEGGSSGSCLLNQSGQVIGVLSGGSAACSGTNDNGGFDIWGRIDTAWNGTQVNNRRLNNWLDPTGSNVNSQNGSYTANLSIAQTTLLDLNVYPNPSKGLFTVGLDTQAVYKVYSLSGQLIQSGNFENVTNQIDLSKVSNGVYFMTVTAGEASNTVKLIKE